MHLSTKESLERATPESLGISSLNILRFLDDLNTSGAEIHSFLLLRHDKVAAEGWWSPYNRHTPHVLYSMSKSITSTAVGFAVDEGLLALDDTIGQFFPEIPKSKKSSELTVRQLLTMKTDKNISFLQEKEEHDWVAQFFKAGFLCEPGKKFNYISENSYMLSAIVTRLTGQCITDYLTPRLFEPLGIEKPFWETDGQNIAAGGWGLYMKTEDLAKIFSCYLHKGMFRGQQIIPAFWVEEATKKQTETLNSSADYSAGYGFQFWQNRMEGTFRADGLFGQLCYMLPEYDALMILQCGEPESYHVMDVFWRHFPEAFEDAPLPEAPKLQEELRQRTASLSLPDLPVFPRNLEMEKKVTRRRIQIEPQPFATLINATIYQMLYHKPGCINNMMLNFKENEVMFTWTEKGDKNSILAGLDGRYRYCKIHLQDLNLTTAAKASWQPDGALELWIRPIETAHMRRYLIYFLPNDKVFISSSCVPSFGDLAVYYCVFTGHVPGDEVSYQIRNMIQKLSHVVDPPMLGSLKRKKKRKKS